MTVRHVIERSPQAAVVVILQRDEAEGLEHARCSLAHGTQNLCHAVNRTRLGLKRNFYEVAFSQRTRQLQESAGYRYGLEFSFSVPAVF